MKKLLVASMLGTLFSVAEAKINVSTPESFTLTTRQGLVLQFSNQLEGLPNNDAVSYLVVTGTNKSQRSLKLAPEDFALKDEAGNVIAGISARQALRTVVEWNFERAEGYMRFGDADLRDVLRTENRRYTTEREFAEVSLKPRETVREKLLFFPKLKKGKYTLELAPDRVNIRVTADGVYFVRPEKSPGAAKK